MTIDRFDLKRFLDAQDGVYARATDELRLGRKQTHWMWFVFPQLHGLGHSATARKFAISSAEEARAYLQHPVLGERLKACTRLVTDLDDRSIEDIFGYPDFLKFHSSMTLFAMVAKDEGVFEAALAKYFQATRDRRTLDLL
jgi:uncharacterized protein (DUF1810 family)